VEKFFPFVTMCVLFFASSITTTTVPTTPTTTTADPFYEDLFEEGKYFYQNGNYLNAIENFEIAFFGFPDNLPRLLECYIYLTVCFFKEKNLEKSKHFNSEINRLNLQEYLNEINLPKDLMDKFLEINSYFSRFDSLAKIARSPSSSVKTSYPTPTSTSSPKSLELEIVRLKQTIKNNKRNLDTYFRLSSIYVEQKKFTQNIMRNSSISGKMLTLVLPHFLRSDGNIGPYICS